MTHLGNILVGFGLVLSIIALSLHLKSKKDFEKELKK
jgi:hypothetical protein